MRRPSFVEVAAAALLFASPLPAQTPPAAGQDSAGKKAPDPNEVVCQRQEVIGSRVQSKRVCMTRAQWADLRSQDRQEIERVQVKRGMIGE